MIDFLLGVPGKLKTLIDYLNANLSTTRAAKIDNLDAAISTRAPSSTALSNANYTAARAGYLDNLGGGAVALRSDPLLSPPIAANFPGLTAPSAAIMASTNTGQLSLGSGITSSPTPVDVLNITGAGVLNFLVISNAWNNAQNIFLRLIIDGVTVVDAAANGTPVGQACLCIGAVDASSAITFDQIPFRSSLRIQAAGGSSQQVAVYWKLRRTA